MPRNSQLDLMWPVGGVDRSLGTQRQHPFTTPDALNVRTEDQREFRQRGGSRPGLGLALRTQLPAQVDLLTKVSIIKAKSSYYNQIYRGSSLRDATTPVTYVSAPDYEPGTSYQGNVARLYGNSWGVSVPDAEVRDDNEPFEISLHLTPDPANPFFAGTAEIGYGMASGDVNPRITGWVASIAFTQETGGHYVGTISEYGSGLLFRQRIGPTKDGNTDLPGILSLRILTSGAITTTRLYWRDELLTFFSAPIATSHSMFRVDSPDSSIQVSAYMAEKWWPTESAQIDRNQRQDRLVAISQGYLHREKTKNSLEMLPTSITFVNGYQLTAVDREQKLYIADYGVSIRSNSGVTYSPYNALYQADRDFVTEGVTSDYILTVTNTDWTQNEIQRVSLDTCDGGSFRLIFMGANTGPLPGMRLPRQSRPRWKH